MELFKHINKSPLYRSIIWVKAIDLKPLASKTLGKGTLNDGTGVEYPFNEVWDNIQKEGMRDPLVVFVSVKDKTYRLGYGNNRIKELLKGDTETVPVVFLAQDSYPEHPSFKPIKNWINTDALTPSSVPYYLNSEHFIETMTEGDMETVFISIGIFTFSVILTSLFFLVF